MTIQMKIDVSELKGLTRDMKIIGKEFPKLGEKIRRRLANRTKKLAKSYVEPEWMLDSTGQLKNSIIYKKTGANSTDVIAQAPYAVFVELGTKPHKMRFSPYSKGDRLSRFWRTERGKKFHKAGSTRQHPGSQPMGFMDKAYRQILKESNGILQEEVSKFFSKRKL